MKILPKLDLINIKKSFGLTSNAYYSFDFNNVLFIIMNTQTPYTVGSSQYNFIKDDLAKAAKKDNTNWIIVVIHEPFIHLLQVVKLHRVKV